MKNITIAGAGLVGSLVGIYLAKKGHNVHIVERRSDMRKELMSAGRSINLALSDRGLRGLEGAGIDKDILKVAIPMRGRMMHSISGEQTFQPYGLEHQAINSVSRGGINIALMNCAESLPNLRISFNQKVLDVELDTATLVVQDNQSHKRTFIESDCIIGADGAFSSIREKMMKTDRFNYSQSYIEQGYKELSIPPAPNGSFQLDKNCLHIWPRKQYMLIGLPNLDGSFTCTLFFPFEGNPSFETLKTEADVLTFFKEEFPDVIPLMPTLLEDFMNNPISSLLTVKSFPWSYSDKVLLIGDASHAILPFFGQGMNAGFEDCTVLNECLDRHPDNWETAFKEFETMRKPNADAIADLALENFVEMRDKVADPIFLRRKKIERLLQIQFSEQFTSLYSMVTFSHIPYFEAQTQGRKQDGILEELMTIENIENEWNSTENQIKIVKILEKYY
ncbi:MAG: FAD-dependent monooxygenase [Bacteroidetes bacterium]|nr:FAD-dependent monooxygenase [Bacteroidota bacterium]